METKPALLVSYKRERGKRASSWKLRPLKNSVDSIQYCGKNGRKWEIFTGIIIILHSMLRSRSQSFSLSLTAGAKNKNLRVLEDVRHNVMPGIHGLTTFDKG